MSNFVMIKLGKTSGPDIIEINAMHKSPLTPFRLKVTCAQVMSQIVVGDYVFVYLGSDDKTGKGRPTVHKQGLRALGKIISKDGGELWADQCELGLELKVVLPDSLSKSDMLKGAPVAYSLFNAMPAIGLTSSANQTAQLITADDPEQNVQALLYAIKSIYPDFESETVIAYPDLKSLFAFTPEGTVGATASIPKIVAGAKLSTIVELFLADAAAAGMRIDEAATCRFFASLLAKRFLISTGLAGSGKTKLAQAFAAWMTPAVTGANPDDKGYQVVSVGADWIGNENILGYANGLDEKSYVAKGALDLMMRATDNPKMPHILILDEMNLSHVERYFADILSVIESDEKIHLHRDEERKANGAVVPNEIELPKNLFIVGTVNVDETTYMFSPKVLDRANVIEFRMDETDLQAFLGNPAKPDMAMLAGKGAAYGETFVEAARRKAPAFVPAIQTRYESEMLLFFRALRGNGAEYGYRVAHEAARFIHFYKLVSGNEDGDLAWFETAFDCLIAQKFLPKLHGSRAKLGPLLKKLWFLSVSDAAARGTDPFEAAEAASRSTEKKHEPGLLVPEEAPYKLSAEKIGRMWRLLNDNGFASFAEA